MSFLGADQWIKVTFELKKSSDWKMLKQSMIFNNVLDLLQALLQVTTLLIIVYPCYKPYSCV